MKTQTTTNKEPVTKRKNTAHHIQPTESFRHNGPLNPILDLQRSVGNLGVLNMLQGTVFGTQVSGVIQGKLNINQPGDLYEKEADRVAEQVMNSDAQGVEIKGTPLPITPLVQRQTTAKTPDAAPAIESNINSLKGHGQPLDPATRAYFEPRFGQDFSKVRIHTSTAAAESAHAMNAKAYTFGQDIVFGAGEYASDSPEGKRLLGHELTHVVQQRMSAREGLVRRKVKVEKKEDKSQINAEVDAIIQKMKFVAPDNPVREEWNYLAQAIKKRHVTLTRDQLKAIEDYFTLAVERAQITFETITEDQRTVFLALQPTLREELRKKALRSSKLFRAVTDMHLDMSKDIATRERMRETVDRNRFRLSRKDQLLIGDMSQRYSVAANIMYSDGKIMADVFNNIPANAVNKELSDYIRTHDLRGIVRKLHVWACGIGNLYAISKSRSKTGPDRPGESAIQHATQWFKDWTLGKPNTMSIVYVKNGKLAFRTGPILTELSERKEGPISGSSPCPDGTGANDEKAFSASIEASTKSIRDPQQNARVGVGQGEGHMYIVYLDLDGYWRSMDIYMNLADKPEGGVPNAPGYATRKLWHKLILDNTR